MKKTFVTPKVTVMNISTQNIICTSCGHGIGSGGKIPVCSPGVEVTESIEIW